MGMVTFTREKLQELARTQYYFLVHELLKFTDWDDTLHTDVARVLWRPSRRKLFLLPRGHLKTSMITKSWSIKNLLCNPNIRILIAHEVWDKSREMLFEIKELLTDKSDLSKIFGEFKSDKWNEDSIVIQQRTRALAAPTIATTGVEAEMTSAHFDLIFLDDLVGMKNYQTKDQRDKVVRFYRNMLDLLEPDGTLIICGTRWHQSDLYAEILETEGQYYDTMVRRVVENSRIIFPAKFNQRFNKDLKRWELCSEPCMDYIDYLKISRRNDFFSQYMNNPVDQETAMFKQAWIKYYEPGSSHPNSLYLTVDPAISVRRDADFSALVVAGQFEDRRIRVVDYVHRRMVPSDLVDAIFDLVAKWKLHRIGIENYAFQKILKYDIQNEQRRRNFYFSIDEMGKRKLAPGEKEMSKDDRILRLQPLFEQGLIEIRRDMTDLEDELLNFPKSRHKDIADALAWQLDFLVPSLGRPSVAQTKYMSVDWWIKNHLKAPATSLYDEYMRDLK